MICTLGYVQCLVIELQERTRVVHQQMNMVEDFSHDAPSSMLLQPVRGMGSLDGHGPMDGYHFAGEVGGEVVEKAFRSCSTQAWLNPPVFVK